MFAYSCPAGADEYPSFPSNTNSHQSQVAQSQAYMEEAPYVWSVEENRHPREYIPPRFRHLAEGWEK